MTETPVTSNEIENWLAQIASGLAETIVTSEGKGWSFNCDGTAHYLQGVDVTRREPNGRYKRVYKGKIEGSHVTYKGVTSAVPCPSQYERWANSRHVTCKIQGRGGENAGRIGDSKGLAESMDMPYAEWRDAKTVYLH